MSEAREYTTEEVQEMFLNRLHGLVDYWSKVQNRTTKEQMDGLVFSILNIFDGTSADLPMMNISLNPHHSDQEYRKSNGKNWFKPGMVFNDCYLHDMWHSNDNETT